MSGTAVIDMPINIMDRLDTATFDELAEHIQQSVLTAGAFARRSVCHFIEAGGALCEMRDRMPGRYTTWLGEVGLSVTWATQCQRLYTYREHIPVEAFAEKVRAADGKTYPATLTGAIKSIAHLPNLSPRNAKSSDDQRSTVKQMLKSGASVKDVVVATGLSRTTIRAISDPNRTAELKRKKLERLRVQTAAMKALREKERRAERDQLARTAGKESSVAYAAVRQALAALDKISPQSEHVERASQYLVSAEHRIVAIMQEERANQ